MTLYRIDCVGGGHAGSRHRADCYVPVEPDDVTTWEVTELAKDIDNLMIHHHKGKASCLTFDKTWEPTDDRRMLTALRLLTFLCRDRSRR